MHLLIIQKELPFHKNTGRILILWSTIIHRFVNQIGYINFRSVWCWH